MIDFCKKAYYRYTLMTGVYMLGNIEVGLLHLAYFVGIFFLARYTSWFWRDIIAGKLTLEALARV
jgi:hypothetical protein